MENNNLNQEILDKITKVCVCKAISRATIKDVIAKGAHTVDDVVKVTGACTGGCKGFRCKDKIQTLINDHLNSN
ncbi:(2Fe-2S)-binding protein [Clostridium sp. NSJ-49]|jgi:bacterioferritin-associated ferredoxin|uniref:(2Fe-2S)-binding protein n=1 Tax=Clostridium disporicum TaxID=84024 RepID=A0A174EJZ3_9CLOT|nr:MULTISPECIES: (2Fe-2S)-binding protein [Clostridium]MBC5624165.1 (2Fe-2S)-binding protein [Clostridium sp. NSJ-49]MCD2502593.1 (2Fe-2S)-binding protein [Clostridium sp. NSJ-145]CUO37068.1 (2Fe-2S)-binding protein [Clostridium disporicum]